MTRPSPGRARARPDHCLGPSRLRPADFRGESRADEWTSCAFAGSSCFTVQVVCETVGVKDVPDPVADSVAEPGEGSVGWSRLRSMASVRLLGGGRDVPRGALAEWTGACGRVTSNLPGGRAVR